MAQVEKILSIQALRGISAAAVVFFHVQGGILEFKELGAQHALMNSHPALRLFGTVGVDIFFVISGVVITLVTWDHFGKLRDIPVFLEKRVIRIFPIYWLNLLPWVVWYYLQARLFHGNNGDPEQAALFLSSFFLFPYPTPMKSTGGYALFVAWTLTFELYFYCITAFCLCFARKYFLPLVCGIFLASGYALAPYADQHPFLAIISDSLLMEFVYGILIGMALRNNWRIPSAFCILAICAACLLLWLALSGSWGLGGRGYSQGLPAALIVFGAIFIERSAKLNIPGWLVTLGNCSYSLYLIHPLIRLGMGKIWKVTGALPAVPADVLILSTCLVSVMAGYLCWRVLEQPLMVRLSRRLIMPSPHPSQNLHSRLTTQVSDSWFAGWLARGRSGSVRPPFFLRAVSQWRCFVLRLKRAFFYQGPWNSPLFAKSQSSLQSRQNTSIEKQPLGMIPR